MPSPGSSSTTSGLARVLDGLARLGAVGATRNVGAQLAAERDAAAAAEALAARVERARRERVA